MERTEGTHLGLAGLKVGNGHLTLFIPYEVGPRILALWVDGTNLFAEVPEATIPLADGRGYRLLGGHRLWHAPELPERTYVPDEGAVSLEMHAAGFTVFGTPESRTGIRKGLRVFFPDDLATVVVDHILENHTLWPIPCAAWAITQLPPGGFAILPQATGPSDPAGVLPNRRLALWPYTDIRSPHIWWGNRYVFVLATMDQAALKLGYPNPRGWLAYFHRGFLFVKWATWHRDLTYYDEGSSHECYCDPRFLELETLGPQTLVPPGGHTVHREVWRVYHPVDARPDESVIDALADRLGLDTPPPALTANP